MSLMSNEELWRMLNYDSDDDGEVFEGFSREELVKVAEDDAESDLDIDFEAVAEEIESDSEESDGESGSSVDRLPDLPKRNWQDSLHKVSIDSFKENVGVAHDLAVGANPLEYFSLFFSDSMLEKIVEQTNLYAIQVQEEKKADPRWQPVTLRDIKLYLAINILMGIHILPRQENYWSNDDKLNVPCISSLMPRTRFEKIGQYFHLNDRSKFCPRGHANHDPLFKVCPVLDACKAKCGELYKPGQAISTDEAMVKFNGRLHFKQYMKSKPTPWGIKIWCSADPTTGYLLDFDVYTGKAQQPLKGGLGHHVVMTVGKNYLEKGHHFYHDNFFTSVALADELLAHKTRSCGTIRMNRKGWPDDPKVSKSGKGKTGQKTQKGEVKFRQLGSMVATLWRDKRTIAVLSTNVDPVMGKAPRQTGKGKREEVPVPQPVLTYNRYMGGVDLHDQHRSYYPVGRSCRKWWRYLFWFFVQSSLINSFIIFCKTNSPRPKSRRLQDPLYFRLAVFEGMVRGSVITKRQVTMQPSLTGRAVTDPTEHALIRLPGRKKSCVQCLKMGRRQPSGHSKETVMGCSICKAHLRKRHCFAQFHAELLQ